MTSEIGPKLKRHQVVNFKTLQRAFDQSATGLVSARRLDGTPVALICAMQVNDDDTITPMPFAELIEGNPFELYQDPTRETAHA